jgi:hypothetical protein
VSLAIGYQGRDPEGNLVLWQPYTPCPCGCEVTGSKLSRSGHVSRCACRSCIGTRNQRKGKRGQANAHRLMGGEGFTPSNEESGRAYSLNHRIEAKKGQQIPAAFVKFLGLDWTRRAFSQAKRGKPVGEESVPSIYLELAGGGAYLVTELKAKP